MASKPKISVIIPVYNRGDILPRAIKSVLAQTFEDFELIIVDDASTDNTVEVAKSFQEKDDRIKVYELEENSGGPARPKNVGVAKSKGKYIAFLDSDDRWVPKKLDLQLRRFEHNQDMIGVVCSGMEFVDTEEGTKALFEGFKDHNQEELLKELYLNPINSSSVMMVKRKCFEEVGKFNEEQFDGWDDYEFLFRVAKKFKIKYVRKALVKKLVHQDNFQKNPEQIYQSGEVFDYIAEFHPFLLDYKNIREAKRLCSISMYKFKQDEDKSGSRRLAWEALKKKPLFVKAWGLYLLYLLPRNFYNLARKVYWIPRKIKALLKLNFNKFI